MRATMMGTAMATVLLATACSTTSTRTVVTQPMPPCGPEAVFSTFELGSVWSYETRPGEESSTFTVRCIEEASSGGRTVHIEVGGVATAADGSAGHVGHVAVAEDALSAVIVERVGADDGPASPGFLDGYVAWRQADGEVWTVPLADVLDELDSATSSG